MSRTFWSSCTDFSIDSNCQIFKEVVYNSIIMKKKILTIALAALLAMTVSVSAFATAGFNKAVFDGKDDIEIEYDDMTGKTKISVPSLFSLWGDGYLSLSNGHGYIYPRILSDSNADLFCIAIEYISSDWAFIDKAIVKIGDNRYTFDNVSIGRQVLSSGKITEYLLIYIDKNSAAFMADLIEHREEEIKVRLVGKYTNQDFVLSESVKDKIINLYNLYSAAGGTNETNLDYVAKAYNVNRGYIAEKG